MRGNEHGQILSADADMAGRVYCRRLFVGMDDKLRAINIGVNLNVQVARDRHLVPSGTWPAIQAILESACATHRKKRRAPEQLAQTAPVLPQLLALFMTSTEDQFRQQLPFIKPALRTFCAITHGATDDKYTIFLDHPNDSTLRVLNEIGYITIHPAGALADACDLEELTRSFIDKAPAVNEASLTERASRSLLALKHLTEALSLSVDSPVPLVLVKCLSRAVAQHVPQAYGNHPFRIVVNRDMLDSDDELVYCAQECGRLLTNRFTNFYEQPKLVLRIVTKFIRDPYRFEARKYTHADMDLANSAPPAAAPAPAASSGVATPGNSATDWAKFDARPQSGAPATQQQLSAALNKQHDLPNLRIGPAQPPLQMDFTNDPHLPVDNEGPDALACSSFDGHLIPLEISPRETVHIDATKLDELTRLLRGDLIAALAPTLPLIVATTRKLLVSIAQLMPQPFTLADLPLIFVAVRPTLWAFTKHGHIYLNVVPLVLAQYNGAQLWESIFLTLLHELVHRQHHAHDTHFADTLAKLVYRLRNCRYE